MCLDFSPKNGAVLDQKLVLMCGGGGDDDKSKNTNLSLSQE
jgi:hypothetical protein